MARVVLYTNLTHGGLPQYPELIPAGSTGDTVRHLRNGAPARATAMRSLEKAAVILGATKKIQLGCFAINQPITSPNAFTGQFKLEIEPYTKFMDAILLFSTSNSAIEVTADLTTSYGTTPLSLVGATSATGIRYAAQVPIMGCQIGTNAPSDLGLMNVTLNVQPIWKAGGTANIYSISFLAVDPSEIDV